MKKILILLGVVLTGVWFYQKTNFDPTSVEEPQLTPRGVSQEGPQTPEVVLATMDTFFFEDQTFHYAVLAVDDPASLKLFPNHQAKAESADLISTCSGLVSGGFYDLNGEPIGWLVAEGRQASPPVLSDFLNGYLSLNQGQVSLSNVRPQGAVDWGLQSGPPLIANGLPLPLRIKNDEPRRRVVAATTLQGQLVFLALVGEDSAFTGPLLAETPRLLVNLAETLGLSFTTALNLDGGSASTFYNQQTHLEEFSLIGSYFCLAAE
ncbi:TPA: hypothetical protein DIU13_00490 [Candidatus Beckwithbacteria bacterium]|nr:hypothetical protein [Candidatus Beckwithbacteria bacterium]